MAKYYCKLNNTTYSINLAQNFSNYFKNSDENCDKVGYRTGTNDSHYRVGNQIIYAENSHPYPIETKLSSVTYQNSDRYYTSRLVMTGNIKFNTTINKADIDSIEFTIESTNTSGGGSSEDYYITSTHFPSEFNVIDSNTLVMQGGTLITSYLTQDGNIIRFTSTGDSDRKYSPAIGYSYASSTRTSNYRKAKLKITINYKDGVRISSYVISDDYDTLKWHSNTDDLWIYFGNNNIDSRCWYIANSSETVSDWYPMVQSSDN